MSGVIPDSIITVSVPITPDGAFSPYRIISFPSRVKVTGASFTVDSYSAGDPEDNRVYILAAVKGKKAKAAEAPAGAEDIVPFFGWEEKPTVTCSQNRYLSNTLAPLDRDEWYTYGNSYVADIAQMDTDEYLTVWVYPESGTFIQGGNPVNPEDFNWGPSTATISISYTGATNLD